MSDNSFYLLHPGVQKAIWALGWRELRPIQSQAILALLQGDKHLVISAHTAGGKTEAAFLPIISRIAANRNSSIQALYVGPLKALINDQFIRLEKLCQDLDIPIHRWHGDITATRKQEIRSSPDGILLITPESLESNFINYGNQVPYIYRELDFVVIDELHSFLDNVRGIHLRSLVSRLFLSIGRTPRLIGLSATLSNPEAACSFLSPDAPQSVMVIDDPDSHREIKLGIKVFMAQSATSMKQSLMADGSPSAICRLSEQMTKEAIAQGEHLSCFRQGSSASSNASQMEGADLKRIAEDIVRHFSQSTNLIFVNNKRLLEDLADRIHEQVRLERLPTDPFIVHHGSISKELRLEAESNLKSGLPTTAICSSTLEMGIDIGSVRTVGQIDPPWTVSSMVQRLGRSGRREGEPAVMRMYVREEIPHAQTTLSGLLFPKLVRAIALTRLMLEKWLEPVDFERMHLSTLVHQILSCLKQTGGIKAAKLYEALGIRGPFRKVSREMFATILRGLCTKELIEQMPEGDLILAPLGERITSGFDFYSAFKAQEEFAIRHGDHEIGKLASDNIPPVGEHVILAGQRWRVEEIDPISKVVFVTSAPGRQLPRFGGSGIDMHTRVAKEMKAVLLDSQVPQYLDESGKLLLQTSRSIFAKAGLKESDMLIGTQGIRWYPWVGTRCLITLALGAKAAGIPSAIDAEGLSIHYTAGPPDELRRQLLTISYDDHVALARLMPVKLFEKYDEFIPEEILDAANATDRLSVAEAREATRLAINHLSSV